MRLIFEGNTDLVLSSLQIRAVSPSGEHDSLQERFDASGTVAWTSETATSAGLLAEGMDLTRYPPGRLRAFGHSPSLLLPEVQWPSDGTVIGWIEFSVPENTMAQLFYLSGPLTEYSEEASIPQFVKRGRNMFIVNVTANLTGRLRFDPGRVRGDYEIHAVRLYSRRPSAEAKTLIARSA